jgi:hypothetical protein
MVVQLGRDARFIDLRDSKAELVEIQISGQKIVFARSKNSNVWRTNFAHTDIAVSFPSNACSIKLQSGPKITRKIVTVGIHDAIVVDLCYLLAGYGAPVEAQAIVARHGLIVHGRAAEEKQLLTFSEFYDNAPQSITVNGDKYENESNHHLRYSKKFDRVVISINFSKSFDGAVYSVHVTTSVPEEYVSRGIQNTVHDSLNMRRQFINSELKEAFTFINNVVDVDKTKDLVNQLRAEQLARNRKRVAQRHESRTWPDAIAINGLMLWRVKASRNYSDSNHSAPDIANKQFWLATRSVFYVKYASPRVMQDGKRVSSIQLHIAPETGDVIIGMRGPRTNSVSVSDGISKVRAMKVDTPVDLQSIINRAAKFLLQYMQKHDLTAETSPSAHIIKRGREIDV